jgi:hypothetical protein
MEQKWFASKSRICFYESKKKSPLLLHCSKKRFDAKKMLRHGSRQRHRSNVFVLLKHRSNFFWRRDLPETSEQNLCTNVASKQKKFQWKSSRDCYGANPQSNCSKKFVLIMQKYRPNVATKIFYCSIVEKKLRRGFPTRLWRKNSGAIVEKKSSKMYFHITNEVKT